MKTATQKNRISNLPAAPLLSEPTKERIRKAKAQRQREGKESAAANTAEITLTVQQWEKAKAAAKELYDQADRLEQSLISQIGIGNPVVMHDGRIAVIVDNFRDAAGQPKVKHYGMAGVKLCELKIRKGATAAEVEE